MSGWQTLLAILGMALITLVTRGLFMLPKREFPLPDWVREGLRYAPLAALAAVIVPEIVMTQGELINTWKDARLFAVAVSTAYFFWRRGILGTIVSGTAVMLILRLSLGW